VLITPGRRWLASLLLGVALLSGCGSNPERPPTYLVKRGDTLYAIAFRHGLNYQDVARWNRIGRDYVIHPGQTLRLYPPSGGRATAVRSPAPKAGGKVASAKPKPAPISRPKASPKASPPKPAAMPAGPPVKWQWPVGSGSATLTSRPNGGHGLVIAGKFGDEIRSAGIGRVVYTGSGLLGYGQLIIVKHSESYLSAYGHLQSVSIKEGDAVAAGQRIATMGNGPQGSPLLYFEIRINGAPGNPLSLLPQR